MEDLDDYLNESGLILSSEQKNKIVVWLKGNAWKSLQSVPKNKYYGLFYEKDKSVMGQTMYHCHICDTTLKYDTVNEIHALHYLSHENKGAIPAFLEKDYQKKIASAVEKVLNGQDLESKKMITSFFDCRRVSELDYVLAFVGASWSFNSIQHPYVQSFLSNIGVRNIPSAYKLKRYTSKVSSMTRDYIRNQLNGRNVCLIIDEASFYGTPYYNFLICAYIPECINNHKRIYFWDSIVNLDGTSEGIAECIKSVINDLEQYNIHVKTYYATDNCNAMRGTEDILKGVLDRIVRVPCASHILNNILKDLFNQEYIKDIWDNIQHCSAFIRSAKQYRQRIREIQKSYPAHDLPDKEEWSFDLAKQRHSLVQMIYQLEEYEKVEELYETDDSDYIDFEGEQESGYNGKRARNETASSIVDDDDAIVIEGEKPKQRILNLKSHVPTRWYSAWSVMYRFYQLYNAIFTLASELCEQEDNDDLMTALNVLHKDIISKVLYFLRPIVEGIDYFQRDDTIQANVLPIILSIKNYLKSHCNSSETRYSIPLSTNVIDELFDKRLSLFPLIPTNLLLLFSDEYIDFLNLTDFNKIQDNKDVASFVGNCLKEIDSMLTSKRLAVEDDNDRIFRNKCMVEMYSYIRDRMDRDGITIEEYFSCHSYKRLKTIYEYIFSMPSSSAAVERSFSIQTLLHTPQRNLTSPDLLRDQLIIRINTAAGLKSGEDRVMRAYYKKYEELKKSKQVYSPFFKN